MRIFDPAASSSGGEPLPDVSSAPRRYRPALAGAVRRSLTMLNQLALQGRPVSQGRLVERAEVADKFWRFLESELSNRRLGSMCQVQVDPRLNLAAQELHGWFARQCSIHPSTVAHVAWAGKLNQAVERQFMAAHPAELPWSWTARGPVHFAALAGEGEEYEVLTRGVVAVQGRDFQFLSPEGEPLVAFSAREVASVHADPEGLRLQVRLSLPYSSLLLLTAQAGLLAGPMLRGAGLSCE